MVSRDEHEAAHADLVDALLREVAVNANGERERCELQRDGTQNSLLGGVARELLREFVGKADL